MFNHKGHKGSQRFFPSLRVPLCPLWLMVFCLLLSCSSHPDSTTVVMIIDSSPANLDPRIGTDGSSERIDQLMFDSLVSKDEHFNLHPWVAERWEMPDPQTYIFHLRQGIHFHDGRPLTSKDVKWTLDSIRNRVITTLKTDAYKLVDKVEAPNDSTLLIHLTEANATLLWSLSEGAFGIVPYGSGKEFSRNPIGSGPFRFVRHVPDSEVVIERNHDYWGERPHIERVRFAIVPDTTTRALELRKGSADLLLNSLSADIYGALRHERNLEVVEQPGTNVVYLAFNLRDPILKDVRVRQALAYAIDRQPILHYLFGDEGKLADSILPPQHWAYNGNVPHYSYDPEKANALLDSAGYARGKDGMRFHLTMKTSTEETTRLLAAVLQQQLRKAGIALDIRSFEFTTFYADVVKGAFQVYSLRWVGATNQDPDIFEYVFHSASFAPKRANRSYYSNPQVDALIEEGRKTIDQKKRAQIYAEVQQIVAREVPSLNLWYLDNMMVHSSRIHNVHVSPAGNYDFLRTAEVAQ